MMTVLVSGSRPDAAPMMSSKEPLGYCLKPGSISWKTYGRVKLSALNWVYGGVVKAGQGAA
jgi:hypothetical protein